jgi:hypothetical protein
MICEINPDPALQSWERLINKNIANIYAKYIYNKIYSNLKWKK